MSEAEAAADRPEPIAPADSQEKAILSGFSASRSIDESEWKVMTADVIFMLSDCFRQMASACEAKSWPELFAQMQPLSEDPDNPEGLMNEVKEMHQVVAKLLLWIQYPDNRPGKNEDSLFTALQRVGWRETPMAGRTTYLSMLGLYHISRVYSLGRQQYIAGLSRSKTTFEMIAQNAGETLRIYDQKINPYADANEAIKSAVMYAMRLGLNAKQIDAAVTTAMASFNDYEAMNLEAMSRAIESPLRANQEDAPDEATKL